MSWDSYCTNLKAAGMNTNCIIGLNNQIYAQCGNAITAEQATSLARRASPSCPVDEKRSQLKYAGCKYLFVKEDDDMIQGKQMGGQGGICCAWAKTLMIVGVYEEGMTGGQASKAVGQYRDHLKNSGL